MKPVKLRSQAQRRHEDANRPPREKDPNQLTWIRFNPKDEKQLPYLSGSAGGSTQSTAKLTFYPLWAHPTKCPQGYIQQIRMKLRAPGERDYTNHMSRKSISPDEFCPLFAVSEEFDAKLKDDAEFADWWDSINVDILQKPQEHDEEAVQDAQFKQDYLKFCDVWNSYLVPGVLMASYDEKRSSRGPWNEQTNFRPDAKNPTPTILQLSDWAATHRFIDMLQTQDASNGPVNEETGEPEDDSGNPRLQINRPGQLLPVTWHRENAAGRSKYCVDMVSGRVPGALPKAIQEKLNDMSDSNYN